LSITLDHHMDTIFQNGLKIVRVHEESILKEWEQIVLHLQDVGETSAKSAEVTIKLFSDYLFRADKRNQAILNDMEPAPHHNPASFQTNQFIITLLENAVHKVTQRETDYSHRDHQAVQYLFSTISEHILTHPYQKHFAIDSFLKHLVSSQQLPIEWAAILIKKDHKFVVEKWFNEKDQDLLLGSDELEADTIYSLSEMLLKQMSQGESRHRNVLPVPYEDGTLLLCINKEDTSHIIPFITYSLQVFKNGRDALKMKRQERQWKDSVIMFNETMIRSTTYENAIENIAAGFVNYLPFERCALFSYSDNDQMSFGLYGHRLDINAIQNITENMDNLPLIQDKLEMIQLFGESMNYIQPLYVSDATKGFPKQYIDQFNLRSLVVAPIFTSSNKLIGAALLDQGPDVHFKVAQETFSALIKFGQSAGEILNKYETGGTDRNMIQKVHLSPRETEVLKLMAAGESTNEAAGALHLSEYTVRDYVSSIMQKLEARNRTEAVARAIRDGII